MLIRTIPSEPVVVSFVDTETTALSHRTKYVIEVANLKVVHDKETPWELTELESFEAKLLLPEGVEVSEEARKINGYDPKVWAEQGVDRKDAYRVLIGQLEGSCFGGKNPKFDWMFLDEDFHRLGLSWPKMQHYDLWAVDMLAKPLKLLGFVE